MNYKVLMNDALVGYKAGDIIDLSESDGNSLSQWGIVESAPESLSVTAPVFEPPTTLEEVTTEVEKPKAAKS
jgi:hypothetical protein